MKSEIGMTISEIIEKAGGREAVAAALSAARGEGKEIKPDAIRKWPMIGIPDRHWPTIIEMVPGLTPQDLFDANVAARTAEVAA
jgi:hypothetical protein